jgi:hypothetical protein
MRSDAIIIVGVGFQDVTQMDLAQDNDVVPHTRAGSIRSANPFCQGEPGAVGLADALGRAPLGAC